MAPKNKDAGNDSRFASIQTDPRFILPRKKSIRGEVDSRFKDALAKDEGFAKRAQVDKYGRKVKSKDVKKELSRYYNFGDEEKEEEKSKVNKADGSSSSSDSEDEKAESGDSDDDEESSASSVEEDVPPVKSKKPSMRELMRGEGIEDLSSSDSESDGGVGDSSDSDSDSDDEPEIAAEDEYEQVRSAPSVIPQGDETKRFAVVNLDWDNVTSTDLMATFSSFVPANKRIISVKIYTSEYGKKQMESEEIHGPPQELFSKQSDEKLNKKTNPSVDYDDDQDYSSSRLRKYQLQRLQYYYAVVDCDSVSTAAGIYSSCDGTEYESTANFFDLRFIPDEVDFSGDKPRDECYKVPADYQPRNFTTDALQHSKVKLTWDETPKERERLAQRAFAEKDVENDDLKAYLASDSDSDEDEETIAQRYRALIGGDDAASGFGSGKPTDGQDEDAVEITFNPVLEGKQAKLEILDDENSGKAGKGEAENPEDNLSTIEKYRLKEKQRRLRRLENYKARKAAESEEQTKSSENNHAELELLALDDDLLSKGSSAGLNDEQEPSKKSKKITKRASKKKAQEEAERDFDTADPRFQALFEDPDFAIDSTLPQFKKTEGMERIMQERRKRRDNNTSPGIEGSKPKNSKRKPENSIDSARQLASKLRRKTQNEESS